MSEYTPSKELREMQEKTNKLLEQDPDSGIHWLRERQEKSRRLFGKVLSREDFNGMTREEAETLRILMERPLADIPPQEGQDEEWGTWFDKTYYRARDLYGAEVMDSLPFEEKYMRYYVVATPAERQEMRDYVQDGTHNAFNQAMKDAYQRALFMLDTIEDPEPEPIEPSPIVTGTELPLQDEPPKTPPAPPSREKKSRRRQAASKLDDIRAELGIAPPDKPKG